MFNMFPCLSIAWRVSWYILQLLPTALPIPSRHRTPWSQFRGSSEISSLIQRQLSDTSRVLGHEVCAVGISATQPWELSCPNHLSRKLVYFKASFSAILHHFKHHVCHILPGDWPHSSAFTQVTCPGSTTPCVLDLVSSTLCLRWLFYGTSSSSTFTAWDLQVDVELVSLQVPSLRQETSAVLDLMERPFHALQPLQTSRHESLQKMGVIGCIETLQILTCKGS